NRYHNRAAHCSPEGDCSPHLMPALSSTQHLIRPTALQAAGTPRARERSLLLTNLLVLGLAILCAWAPVRGGGHGREALVTAARELAPLWVAFLLLHVGLVVRRVEADEYLLPLVSLITLIGGLYHLG